MWARETRSACLSIYLPAVTNLHCSLVDKMPVRNIHVASIDQVFSESLYLYYRTEPLNAVC